MIYVLDREENIVEKGENAGHQHFVLFPQCFQTAFMSKVIKSRDCVVESNQLQVNKRSSELAIFLLGLVLASTGPLFDYCFTSIISNSKWTLYIFSYSF